MTSTRCCCASVSSSWARPINDQIANLIVAQLLYLNREDPERDIFMYINSPGGSVYAGLAIYDTMQMIEAPVSTTAVGVTASMGTVLLAAGRKGKRYALPHATVHMHPAGGGAQGYTPDVRIQFKELERVQTQLFHILAKHTGQTSQTIEEDFDRDRWMTALEARGLWPGGRRAGRRQRRDQGAGRRAPAALKARMIMAPASFALARTARHNCAM
jgi:ATP-dependent Clp endopeptidase proteolytic subunit ClpP